MGSSEESRLGFRPPGWHSEKDDMAVGSVGFFLGVCAGFKEVIFGWKYVNNTLNLGVKRGNGFINPEDSLKYINNI